MDRHTLTLLEAIKAAALQGGEQRLYRRGKLLGLFGQRTRHNAEVAQQAVKDGLLEVTRVETVGKTIIEWVRVTQKGLDFLLESESPTRALHDLRAVLAVNQEQMPIWVAQINARIQEQVRRYADEVEQVRTWLDQLARRVDEAIARIEKAQPRTPTPASVSWAQETLAYLESRKQVGLGERCPLADLFGSLKEKHIELSIKDFHAGLKRLHDGKVLALLPSTGNGDAPGPEYALLDGPALYYYVGRA